MHLIDLTHTFTNTMPVFPGDPPVSLKHTVQLEIAGNNDHELHTAMHVGTHMDAPFHMLADGKKIDELALDQFIARGVLIDARGKKEIDASLLENVTIEKGDAVLLMTGLSRNFGSEKYFNNYPPIMPDFADKLIEKHITMVGMDTASPDHNPPWEIHKKFLGNTILILENLTNLESLVNKTFEVIALPMKLAADGAPVRVVAKLLS